MTDSFGPRLRRERERQRISLESIAAATNIRATLFEQLERGDASKWPSGIFRRSFIRAYASAIGLDPESTLLEFLEAFPDPAQPLEPAVGPTAAGRPTELRILLDDGGVDWRRWLAFVCDAGALATVGLVTFLAAGRFWMPVAVAAFAYYSAGTILSGGSPALFFLGRTRAHGSAPASSVDPLIAPFLVHPERGHNLSLDLSPHTTAATQR